MALAEIQQILARLYTDAEFRARYFAGQADPIGCAELAAQDRQQLASVPREQIEAFAHSLGSKRLAQVRHLLPLTCRVLKQQLPGLFFEHMTRYLPRGVSKHQHDAVAFARFLQQFRCKRAIHPAWVTQLARYEAAWLRARQCSRCCLVELLGHDPRELIRAAEEQTCEAMPRQPTLGIWLRTGGGARVRHGVLSLRGLTPSSPLEKGTVPLGQAFSPMFRPPPRGTVPFSNGLLGRSAGSEAAGAPGPRVVSAERP